MKKTTAWFLGILGALIIAVFILMTLLHSKAHPLANTIGLPVVDDSAESSMHYSKRALVFSKEGENYDLYKFICDKASEMYGEPGYDPGSESNEAPNFDLIEDIYSQNLKTSLRIDSRDDYTTIWVLDYKEHVAVFLLVRR
nr:putative integron gene cassette protein [uncultured bacterium]